MVHVLQEVQTEVSRICCPRHLLLVEDNPAHARLFSLRLELLSCDLTIDWVQDGEKGLQYLRREGDYGDRPRPDLVLLDLKMPRMDGHALLHAIKSDETLRLIPVVVLTTSLLDSDLGRARQNGADACLSKPVNLDQFAQVLDTLMCRSCTGTALDRAGMRQIAECNSSGIRCLRGRPVSPATHLRGRLGRVGGAGSGPDGESHR